MAFRNSNSAENWDAIYSAFTNVNFTSFDALTIKQSLIDYLRIYYSEVFNDMIESSELIALLEMFSYVAEQLAYRIDMVSHENFITTAQRKQSILRMAKLISYKATRNIPVRGLVKFTSISTTERITDSRGVNLSGLVIGWNDANNANWKEQYLLAMNRVLTTRFGQPQKTFQVGDVVMDLYAFNASANSFINGVHAFTASTGLDSYPMEVVPTDVDENGPLEREPDLNAPLSIIYANDGIGDGSDYTGFLAYVKQGTLSRIDYSLTDKLPNRRVEFLPNNINHTDVWVQKLDDQDNIAQRWKQVETTSEQNLIFNDNRSTRLKYEVDTLENDQIAVTFGDGDFTEAPQGMFRFWMRQSANRAIVIQKSKIINETLSFSYVSTIGSTETCTVTFSLTSTLQNGSASETIEHVRQAAPATYYAQNRMVNGQDYNTYLLKDPSILRLKTINRTFAGQPKFIDWNDASGAYENVKLFGDDLVMRYELGLTSLTTSLSGQALIDSVIEPLLNQNGVINALLHISATTPATQGVVSTPRRAFIEDNRQGIHKTASGNVQLTAGSVMDGSLKEKTAMQGLIDRHYYGEPIEYISTAGSQTIWARIPDSALFPKDDSKIYAASVPLTVDGVTLSPPGNIGSGLQPIAEQDYFGLRYNRTMQGIGNGTINNVLRPDGSVLGEVWTIEVGADGVTLNVRSSARGTFPTGSVGVPYELTASGFQSPVNFFTVTTGSTPFEAGDAFILDTPAGTSPPYTRLDLWNAFNSANVINLNGWWQILGVPELPHYAGGQVIDRDELLFTQDTGGANANQHSWLILVRKLRQAPSNNVVGYEVHYRELALTVQSLNTKFWYNEVDQLLDSDSKNRVYDNIKVLRSNLDSSGTPLITSQVYDVVGPVKDGGGVVNFHKLQVVPSNLLQLDLNGSLVPDHLLQYEAFSATSYEYFRIDDLQILVPNSVNGSAYSAAVSSFSSTSASSFVDNSLVYGRRQRMPLMVNSTVDAGLDFMWQHFAPGTNIIDPSVTNIHDAFILTQGYYDSVINYLRGLTNIAPTASTPLELRNSYSYLLKNKMLSDTVVLHSGKLRLLFGALAEPQFRAKFKIVRAPGASLTNERVKEELLNVINTYFDISNWDFGETFYATELIALMHTRLPTEIASAVLVPLYSMNSFGDLFTVQCGFDEILQSAMQLSDIEIVEALTPTVIRQIR